MLEIPAGKAIALVDDNARGAGLAGLRWHLHGGKYACTSFWIDRSVTHVFMHHLVLPRRVGMDVDHVNGNTLDNRRVNLRYLSHADNLRAAVARRGRPNQTRNEAIRSLRTAGATYSQIAEVYGLSRQRIHQICG